LRLKIILLFPALLKSKTLPSNLFKFQMFDYEPRTTWLNDDEYTKSENNTVIQF